MNTFDFSTIIDLFSETRKIIITSHTNPDGDAIGSSLALYHALEQLGHEVYVIVPNPFPDFLTWMKGQEKIIIYSQNVKTAKDIFQSAEILFSLDYNSPSRISEATPSFIESNAVKILIDHHIQPNTEAYDFVFSTVATSSTSELVYDFITTCWPTILNKTMAECIYAGIMTDTGSFSYACNYEKTFRTVAELYKAGIDGVKINRLVYQTYSESRLRLLGYALSEKLKVIPEYSTAYISLTKQELDKFDYTIGDTEGLVNYALSIKGIKFAALFSERNDKIRISFRSVGNFSVNDIAREHYAGGGHKNAAGGDSYEKMEKTLENFEKLIPHYKDLIT